MRHLFWYVQISPPGWLYMSSAPAGLAWAELRSQLAPELAPAPAQPDEDTPDWEWSSLAAALPVYYTYDKTSDSATSLAFRPGVTSGPDAAKGSQTAAQLLEQGRKAAGDAKSSSFAANAAKNEGATVTTNHAGSSATQPQGSAKQSEASVQPPVTGAVAAPLAVLTQQPEPLAASLSAPLKRAEPQHASPKSPARPQAHITATSAQKPATKGSDRGGAVSVPCPAPHASSDGTNISQDDEEVAGAMIMHQVGSAALATSPQSSGTMPESW